MPLTIEETPALGVGSVIAHALDDVWQTIQQHHPELPDAVLITGTGAQRNGLRRGHWHPSRWADNDGTVAEVFVAGERLHDGAEGVLTTMLHEAAHGLAHARGVKDTSRQNRYHNKRFAAIAEEVGLCPPEVPCSKLGYSDCTLTDKAKGRYGGLLDRLADAIAATIPHVTEQAVKVAPAPRPRVVAMCGCREVSMTEKQWEEASPLICGWCEERFVPSI